MTHKLVHYSRFIKIEHTIFSIPLLFSGALLAAGGWPRISPLAWIIVAGFGARTAAFSLNRIIDRHIDAANPRTANRELPQRKITITESWAIGAFGTAIYLLATVMLAPICFYLSPIPLLVFAGYPYMKRFTPLAHFGIGLADALAPLGGWLAISHSFNHVAPALWLGAFTFFWVSGFDIIYATLDEDFDRSKKLYSLPALLGSRNALGIAVILHVLAFGTLMVLYKSYLHSAVALASLAGIGALLVLEHRLADDVDLSFFKINAVVGFGVIGFVAAGVFR